MKVYRALGAALSLGVTVLAASPALVACETEDPTFVAVDNAYPTMAEGGTASSPMVVYKVWWEVTLFTEPVLPGTSSSEQRTAAQANTAYVLLAPGWDPESGTPPVTLVPMRSKEPLRVARGETLRISVSDATFLGNCAAGQPLSEADASFITERIFPGDFAKVSYAARTCTSTPLR